MTRSSANGRSRVRPETVEDWPGIDDEALAYHQAVKIFERLNPGACTRVMWLILVRFCPHVPPDWTNKVLTWGDPADDKDR